MPPFYFIKGKKFQEVMLWFPDAIVCGIRRSNGQEYEMIINPAEDYIIGENDGILVLAEDDNSYSPMDPPNELLANPANTSSIPIKVQPRPFLCAFLFHSLNLYPFKKSQPNLVFSCHVYYYYFLKKMQLIYTLYFLIYYRILLGGITGKRFSPKRKDTFLWLEA